MFNRILFGAMCLLWAGISVAQNQYYHADNGTLNLSPSSLHFVVTAAESSTLADINRQDVKQYDYWEHKSYSVLEATRSMTTDEVVASLGFDTDEVQVSTGYALSDGFILYPTRSVVVKLADKNDAPAMRAILDRFGVKDIVKKYGTYRVEMNQLDQVFAAANALAESGIAEFAQPDFYAPIQRYQVNDPLFSQQFQMHNTGQTLDGVAGSNDADCNALEAWGISTGSSGITVAVIDDGMEDHEDFNNTSGQSRYTAGFSPANNGNGDAISGSNHGVACAGSIAASHNSIGVRGVAPLVNLISVNIFVGGESTQDIADGFTWAQGQGADVMSNSWGYTSCSISFSNINNAMASANANGRGGLGSVVVFASGNGYKSCVDYPANQSTVIAVGAFANTGVRSAYSNYGPALDIVAPSNNVGGPGAGVRTTDRMGGPGYNSTNYTSTFGGTSSACPVVSGVAALVLGFNPSLTSTEVKNLLYSTAGAIGSTNEYGAGKVDAFAALQAAGGGGGGPTCTDGVQNGQETGVDCGGPTCPTCPPPTGCTDTEVILSITLDNYPEETSWTLVNDAGQTIASGGTYGAQPDGSTITQAICLVDDCYTFTILDAYGDGICCSYGSGSYSLTEGGTVLASGASFTTSEATDFCIGGSGADTTPPSTPTSLSVSGEQDTQVSLSWNASSDNVGVTGYEVFLDGSSIGTVTGTAADVTGLTACTTYSFGVRALDAAGNASGQATASGTTTGCSGGGGGVLGGYFFETGLEGWADGGSDCARVSSARSYEGSFSVRIRDNSGTASSMTSPAYNLSGLASVAIEFFFFPNSMENGEDFWVQYNSGSGWQTVATYARGTSFQNGQFYTATVTLDAGSYNLTNGGQFRFRCDASGNNDQIYIDQVTVTGFTTSTASAGAIATIEEVPTRQRYDNTPQLGDGEFFMSPNPTSDQVNIIAGEAIREVTVYSLAGRQIMHQTFEGLEQVMLNVGKLPTGMYLISVQTDEELNTERLIVRR